MLEFLAFLLPVAFRPQEAPVHRPKVHKSREAYNRELLIEALRDKSKWPKGFFWNWADCDHCGIGLLRRQHGLPATSSHTGVASCLLGISKQEACDVFINPQWGGDRPSVIASRLEKLHRSIS